VVNAAVLLSPDWQVLGRYDKIHLFQFQSQGAGALDETRVYSPGIEPVVINVKGWRICLSICYDIRFPELYRACLPFDLLMCTAAFTAETGDAHWQPLLRARAIENLCYVAGIGLCGVNQETGLQLHGNSMVVDPWGTVVHHCGRQPETAVVVLHPQGIQSARSRLPALANRRLV
jgi:nitrilase